MRSEELFDGQAIRVFGTTPHFLRSLAEWNEPALWRAEYDGLADGPEFLAETFLGEQFRLVDQQIVRWNLVTGETESTSRSWDEWLDFVRGDPGSEVPRWLLHDWESVNRPLEPFEHLAAKRPFVLGGKYDVDNLYATDSVANLRWNAQLARQMRDIPDGAEVRVSIRWEE